MHTFLCTVCNYNESHSIHPGMLGNSYWRLPELTHELGLAHAFTEITSDRRLHRPLIRRVCVHNSGRTVSIAAAPIHTVACVNQETPRWLLLVETIVAINEKAVASPLV